MPATILSPYLAAPGAVWLRGNLHTHTTRSDGRGAPQETIDTYARLGYDFLALSDHDLPADYSGLDPRGMILLPCSEVSEGGGHVLAVGCRGRIAPDPDRQKVIDAIRAAGGVAVLPHPNWEEDFNHYTFEELERRSRINDAAAGMEREPDFSARIRTGRPGYERPIPTGGGGDPVR